MKTLWRILGVAAVLAVASQAAGAAEISEAEALKIAGSFSAGGTRHGAPGQKPARIQKKYVTRQGTPALYVVETGTDGFVMVSGNDDARNLVLGYGDSPFNESQIPPAMRWWIDQYVDQVETLSAAGVQHREPVQYDDGLPAEVAPLLGYMAWDQSAPYNNDCPEIGGKRCYTGCVATSTAQIMRYHKWPAQGTGSWSYTWTNGSNSENLSVDYSQSVYDWENMPLHYNAASTAAQNAAVAKLMYDIGVGVSMDYGTSESGAASTATVFALLNNFDYDNGMKFRYRSVYGIELWEETLRQELAAGRPVIYAGQSNEGGHQFVCDGYNAEGYFHINWGWSGLCNGYFLTTALVPNGVGAGGFASGYDYNQSIITGIQPNQGHDAAWGASYIGQTFSSTDGINYDIYAFYISFLQGQQNFNIGLAFNTSDAPIISSATQIYNAQPVSVESNPLTRDGSSIQETLLFNNTLTVDPVNDLNLADGTYYVYPVAKAATANDWEVIPTPSNQFVKITVSSGQVTVAGSQPTQIRVSNVSVPSVIPVNKPVSITGTIEAVGGEFYNTLNVFLLNGSFQSMAKGGGDLIDIPAGESAEFSIPLSTGTSIAPGAYTVIIVAGGQQVGRAINVTVESLAVEINAENFPDANFRAAVSSAFDADNNGTLSDVELANATQLSAMNKGIESVEGLSHLYAMQILYLDGNDISAIDLTPLSDLAVLGLKGNQLSAIDISQNEKLELARLTDNNIPSVDVSNNTMLVELLIDKNPILAIDLTNAESLQMLQASSSANVAVDNNNDYSLADVAGLDTSRINNLQGATLSGSTLHFNGDKATYDYNTGNPEFAAMPVTILADNVTGNSDIAVPTFRLTTNGGAIQVDGAKTMTVTDVAGRTIYIGPATSVPAAPGVYIVKADNITLKTQVR